MENTGRELLSCSELDNIVISLSSSAPELVFSNLLEYHIKNYPKITLRDIYKFFHQGTCGWSHLTQFSSLNSIKGRLIEECSMVGGVKSGEMLFELLDTSTQFGRVNLRVWNTIPQLSIEDLWNLMLSSNTIIPKTPVLFIERLKTFQTGIKQKQIMVSPPKVEWTHEWIKLIIQTLENLPISQIPLTSHSIAYQRQYFPHYRLVNFHFLEKFLSNYHLNLRFSEYGIEIKDI